MCALTFKLEKWLIQSALLTQELSETEIILIDLKSNDFGATRDLGYIFIKLLDSTCELSKVI